MDINLNTLLDNLKGYSNDDINMITKAYEYAKDLHNGQYRQSGEPYITHPLNVAYILSELNADSDTICAGLLHDTIEDTNIQKEDIEENFNSEIAKLVDGVTKIRGLNFNKEETNLVNTRKIIMSITEDIRIIIIKLADRLHNMRTLEYKNELKQKENAMETLDIFVPLAYFIGTYRIKSELEDLSLKYLFPDEYRRIENYKLKVEEDSRKMLIDMKNNLSDLLKIKKIKHEIKIRTKNIYGIYRRLAEGYKISEIHDLLALKIMVDSVSNCYQTLGLVHSNYNPINEQFKDYIFNPKANMYRSIHTTVFGENNRLVQNQIRTFDMDKVASFGLTAYWNMTDGKSRYAMQEELTEKYQFFKSLIEINNMFSDNKEFVKHVKSEIFSDTINVYTTKGDIIELPNGSTPIDFAYQIHTDLGNKMVSAIVNDKAVSPDYILHNNDRVRIVTDELSYGPKDEWLDIVQTTRARRKIKEFKKKTN